jgi:hypothetical protein
LYDACRIDGYDGSVHEIDESDPWTACGTGTFPLHSFFFAPVEEPNMVLVMFKVGEYPDNIYVYDPYKVDGDEEATENNLKQLSKADRANYEKWRKTLLFHEQYKNFTGRSYLANYLRSPPQHFMWRADYFGQEHWVETRETHFLQLPPEELLQPITDPPSKRRLSDTDPRILQEYRVADQQTMNMTLKVLSVAPRVFQIDNFLSEVEVQHIVKLAAGITLERSRTGDESADRRVDNDIKTRTSYNSWVSRQQSPIIDAVYRRAADLLRIDEALLRDRAEDEFPDRIDKHTIAEDLQLVHYDLFQGESAPYCNIFAFGRNVFVNLFLL